MASYGLFWKKHNFWTFEQKQTPILIAIDRSFWVIPVSQERQGHDNMTHPTGPLLLPSRDLKSILMLALIRVGQLALAWYLETVRVMFLPQL